MTGTLNPEDAARVYDRIGRLQDWQSFYESPATGELEAHAGFESAVSVFELGCGTGAYAARLLDQLLPTRSTYMGVDVSPKMVGLASRRLAPFGSRAQVELVGGRPPLPAPDHSFARFLAVYVFDLLSRDLAVALLEEAHRLLEDGGRLCLVSLGEGESRTGRAVCTIWNAAFRWSPRLVGGCRPIDLPSLLESKWKIDHCRKVTSWGITSEVVVASPT